MWFVPVSSWARHLVNTVAMLIGGETFNREVLALGQQSLEVLALQEIGIVFVGFLLGSWEKLLCQATRLLLRAVFCFLTRTFLLNVSP